MPDEKPSRGELKLVHRPYSQRKQIVVVDDTSRARKAIAKAGKGGLVGAVGLGAAAVAGSVGFAVVAVPAGGYAAWNWRKKRKKKGQVRNEGILVVSHKHAGLLAFPPGHPQDNIVYVGHPASTTAYYPAAQFHRTLFEHKASEAVQLLMHLGATKLKIESRQGWSEQTAANVGAQFGLTVGQAGLSARGISRGGSLTVQEYALSGTRSPARPEDLERDLVWYSHERDWQNIARGRWERGLKTFSLNVQHEDDLGINADFATAVRQLGFGLGGNFQELDRQSMFWTMEGEFD